MGAKESEDNSVYRQQQQQQKKWQLQQQGEERQPLEPFTLTVFMAFLISWVVAPACHHPQPEPEPQLQLPHPHPLPVASNEAQTLPGSQE